MGRGARALCSFVAVAVLAVPGTTSPVLVQPDEERVRRARNFLSRFADSPCLNSRECSRWMEETRTTAADVTAALREIETLLAEAGTLGARLRSLQVDAQQAAETAKKTRAEAEALTAQTLEKAAGLLAQHHFGINARTPAEALAKQIEQPAARLRCGDRDVIVTLFGYFTHDREVDLTTGPKQMKVQFTPVLFASNTTLGQAIDRYVRDAGLSMEPQLRISGDSVKATPAAQTAKPVHPTTPPEWIWDVESAYWTSATESDGAVRVRVTSAQGGGDVTTLGVKLKARPWWYPLEWLWTNILSKLEVWIFGAVTAIIGYTQGRSGLRTYLWEWMKKKAGG